MISTSPKKEKEAREALGADHFVVSKDEAQMSVSHSHTMCTLFGRILFLEAKSRMSFHCHACYVLPAYAPLND